MDAFIIGADQDRCRLRSSVGRARDEGELVVEGIGILDHSDDGQLLAFELNDVADRGVEQAGRPIGDGDLSGRCREAPVGDGEHRSAERTGGALRTDLELLGGSWDGHVARRPITSTSPNHDSASATN